MPKGFSFAMAGDRMQSRKRTVLFVCVHNAARSQMGEAFLNSICPDDFEAASAGFEPGELDPLAVEVMREVGVDISRNQTKSVFDLFKTGKLFEYVVTVCDEASAERCPIFPRVAQRLHWSLADPAALRGSWDERLAQTRIIRDQIHDRVTVWCDEMCDQAKIRYGDDSCGSPRGEENGEPSA